VNESLGRGDYWLMLTLDCRPHGGATSSSTNTSSEAEMVLEEYVSVGVFYSGSAVLTASHDVEAEVQEELFALLGDMGDGFVPFDAVGASDERPVAVRATPSLGPSRSPPGSLSRGGAPPAASLSGVAGRVPGSGPHGKALRAQSEYELSVVHAPSVVHPSTLV
jgi:hypothetical protein